MKLNKIPYRRTEENIRKKLDRLKLRHQPGSPNEKFGISPVTVRRLAAEGELRMGHERRNRLFSCVF